MLGVAPMSAQTDLCKKDKVKVICTETPAKRNRRTERLQEPLAKIRRAASGEDIGMADKRMDVEAPALSEEPQEAARDETLANMELGKKDVGPKPAETELGKKLKTFALKPEKWVPHFQQLLGVENTEALQYLGTEDYLKLEKNIEHSWEKQALQKLLNIEDPQITQKKLLDEQVEQKKEIQDKAKRELKEKQDKAKQELSENQDKAKKALEDIKKSNKEAKTLTANTAKSTTESFQMHKDKSVKSSKPLEEMIEKSHKELTVTGGSPSNATNLSDADVLYQASGGLALEGIYMTKRQEDVLMKRERLLDVPSGIALAGPLQQPVLKQKEFSSSDEESMFQHSMEKLGFSITTAAKGGFWGFQAEASFGYSSTNMSEKKREFHTEHAYISTTKYSYIPLASCYIPKEKLHLSTAALEELKSIEQLLDYCDKVEKASAKERYKKFFSCFGSHANQGPLHFGGIYWWTASSRGFKQEMLEKVKEETTRAVNASVNVSYSGLLSASAGIDVAKTDTKQSSSKHETKNLEKNIELSVTKTGGPPTVDSPNDWKSGLQANNRTWSVIDRGTHLIPVWDIILSSHKEDFKDVYQVAKDLKNIYASATGLHHNLPIGENVSTAVNEANSFCSQLLSWEVHPTQQQLKRLIDFRQYLNEKTGNYNVWLNVCLPREELRGFLGRVQEFYSQSSREDESVIRCMLKCLLQNIACSSVNEDSYAPLINWIYQSKKEQRLLDVSDFSALIELMSQAKEDLQVNSTDDGNEEIQEATTKLSVIINSYLQSFLKTLRRMEQKEEELLVVCAASCVGYSLQNHYFQQGLGWLEVTFLVEKMQYLINEYRNLKDIKAYRGQAFILAEGLTLGDEDSRHRSTTVKKEFLQFMLEKIGSTLEPEIMTVLQKHSEPFDLQYLIADLNHLRLGTSEAIDNDTTESLVNTLKTIIVSTTESQDQPTITTVETTTDNQNVHSFMEMLGLGQYYPKGLNRRNFHVVHKSLQIHPEKENELPRQFMQMLMGLDYRFRYLVCKNTDVSNAKNVKNPEDDISMFDTVDELFDLCSKEETHVVQTETKDIHPMDLLLAIFHCSDDMMRQYIFTKMSMCQFALPLIVPRPYDSMIEIPLWAFRQVYKSILDTDVSDVVKHKEKTICQSDFPVVCFTRFGTAPFSKSQILNNLLSKHKHDVFFHRNCEGSVKNRILVDGLAEIFWFCPSGKDTDQFKKFTAFVNLHGDALTYPKQSSVLQEISSVNVILFSRSDKKEQGSELLKKLKEKPLIILSPDKESSMNVYTESKQVIIGLKNQNEAKVLKELTDSLCRLLALYSKPCSLERCAEIGRQHGFLVDEDGKECTEGKSQAKTIMSLLKQKDLLKAKNELLPLSGQLWHSWCKKDKELTRLQNKMNQSIEQHSSNIEMEKQLIRKKQIENASQNEFMKTFISQLRSPSKTTKVFFLQWLKIYIDDLSCDCVMDLRNEYNKLWSQLQSEQIEAKDLKNAVQEALESLSDQMNACMFGLEHVLREVGQTYEALYDLRYKDYCFYELPRIAADMMIAGYPIELMDGDACYVPLKWIKAVLGELNKIIGDKKLFVLSVLGVQSSGKSTLLNTMFGLQFAVSAGRCTRGAFMQLVEIADELRKDLGIDYILVIDTEGLRAMELSSKVTLNHDNELATFVIGVGNMTLINVFGENPSEIKDILQIAVQAFLRMKRVKLSSSCLFVHQNVGDLTARDKNMEGRHNLQMELDKMTALAAEQEQCNIQRFSEVIRFDAKTHIYYFAHLWEGNPPMAPPNPCYSEDAEKVKDIILSKQKDSHGILNISELIVRIEDLWSALRNENFVFSFKNTLEISAYSKVEHRYRNLTWQLRRSFLELQTRLNNKIKKSEIRISQKAVEEEMTKTFDSIKEEFEIFFSEDKDKEILIQWKANTENRLKCLYTELVEETTRQAMEHINLKKGQRKVQQRQTGYEEELFTKSKQLALDIKDEGLDESQLSDHFNILWQEWVAEINATTPHTEKPNIIAEAEDVLLGYFRHERSMNDKLNTFSRWTSFSIDLPNHAVGKKPFLRRHKLDDSDKTQIMMVFNNLVVDICDYLEKKRKERVDYNQAYFHEIINKVSDFVSSINSDASRKFTVTNLFKFDVSLHLFGLAVPKFESMHEAFQRANNPVVTLENNREEFFNCFKISCQGAASIKTFSDFLCAKIVEAMRSALYDRTTLAIVDEMTCNFPTFSGNRSKLENDILIDLAEQEDFEKYREYIHFPKRYFKSFIEKCVHDYCLGKNPQRMKNFLQISLDYFRKKILESIIESTKFKNKSSDMSNWLDDFYERIEDLVSFSRADLKSIEHQEIQDIQFFQEVMCTAWNTAIENFQKGLATINFDSFEKKPHEILIEQLCGCWEQCPFCRAICTNTIPGHDGDHSVAFHRSQAINGMPWVNSNEFVTEICSSLVSSDSCLVVDRFTQIPYKHYRKIGPNYANWSITPDTSSQLYWKWYVCKFRTNLQDDYGLKFENRGEIPCQWESIKKEDVIASLRDL
ncbi:interferon-induced very large GTPase 1-like [Aquarana catesbeiana]|uniref:interferon-induced very large GTPase 1-like n=1 Tax=Aquarana catesbeiana TaxID=8400 RepID=UPI003CCA52F8